jgi:sulfite reductase (NADPH) flavoprotein alpha-component
VSAEPIHALIPLPEDKAGLLTRLVDGLDTSTLNWLSGYTAGLAAAHGFAPTRESAPLTAVESTPQQQLTIVFGSQTGNAKRLADALARDAENAGLAVRLLRADAYPLRELKNERLLYIVISTQGEGDPPDDARGFVEFVASKRAPKLDELKFAVLGLGDSSYAKFCAIGAQLDARLAELGATRLFARGDADVDIDTTAKPWHARALVAAREMLKAATPLATVTPLRPAPIAPAAQSQVASAKPAFQTPLVPNSPIQTTAASFGSDLTEPVSFDPRLQSYLIRHYQATGSTGQPDFVPYILLTPSAQVEPRQVEKR